MPNERRSVIDPHSKPADVVATELGVDIQHGLERDEATSRLAEFGPNRIEDHPGPGRWQLLARQFTDVLVMILIAAALISGVLLGDWLEAGVIVAIVFINAVIGYIQEAKAADAAEGLRKLVSPEATVVRGGVEVAIPTEDIVLGDLIVVEAGARVFADARLVTIAHMAMDESELTGESTGVEKTTDPAPGNSSIGDRTSMVFAGTVAVSGHGTAIVTGTGGDTEIGRIAGMLGEEEPPTPLETELAHVGKRLGLLAGGIAVLVLAVGLLQGRPLESMFLLAVALAVAAIPEGLPAVVGVTLGIGVQKMARLNAIVRRLPAVEALGAVTVICTDKTGTLTRNEIRVQEVALGERPFDITAEGDDPRVRTYARAAALCNDSRRGEEGWRGDPTEIALLMSVSEIADPAATRSEWRRVDEVPFESERKRMTTLHERGGRWLVVVKGAPEVVVPGCSRIIGLEGTADLDDQLAEAVLAHASDMAGRGLRPLALAQRELDSAPDDLNETARDLTLVALVGMSDQIREEAKESVAEAVGAGIEVVMITGDHEVTARAIAEELDLLAGRNVLAGRQLHEMGDDEFQASVRGFGAYARVDPGDKVRIVRAWQGEGEIVAMTGDGVNDSPALRISDIGVAMGSGTDVARDASDIVLADDNFATIVAAVRSGRTIFANIRKVISFLLAANVSEVIVVFLGFLLFSSLGDPLLATQILWVNLITDGLPAIALGFDPPDHLVMQRPPSRRRSLLDRHSQIAILVRGALLAVPVLAAYFIGIGGDLDWELTRTLGFTTLVLVQLTYIYALRVSASGWQEGLGTNRLLHGAVGISVLLQVLVVATPLGNRFFSTVALPAELWILAIGLAVAALLIVVAAAALFPSIASDS